ncbi:hypothetical protein [Moraxella caprae]|nr:hypothetical protein [Moraxella caprae]
MAGSADLAADGISNKFSFHPDNTKFLKFGSMYTAWGIGQSLGKGQYYDAMQGIASASIGYAAGATTTLVLEAAILTAMGSTAIVATGVLAAGVPLVIGAVVGTAVTVAIDSYMDSFQTCDKDPTEDFKPNKDESPEKGYTKQYYDPIILDLDGNGVGTVSKFGVLFMMSGGAMFDHDGDGIATQAGWVAVNDEWWEGVV